MGRTNWDGALLNYSGISGSYYSLGRTNREEGALTEVNGKDRYIKGYWIPLFFLSQTIGRISESWLRGC